MNDARDPQSMKPMTAAQKLGVYLPATPEEFQSRPLTRAEVDELQANPPAWLTELRANGPHPRSVVAGKLGVSIAGLARGEAAGGATEALTTAEIQALLQAPPQWLVQERATQAEVRFEKERVRERDAERRAKAEVEAHDARYRPSGGGGR